MWAKLREEFDIDIFCGFWTRETDEGMTVLTEAMKILSDRSISLGFCVYAPLSDEEPKVQPPDCTEPCDTSGMKIECHQRGVVDPKR